MGHVRLLIGTVPSPNAKGTAPGRGRRTRPGPPLPNLESPWTKPTKVDAPTTPAGVTKAPDSKAETAVPAEVAAWREIQKARSTGNAAKSRSAAAEATPYLPQGQGQGQVPWHRILGVRHPPLGAASGGQVRDDPLGDRVVAGLPSENVAGATLNELTPAGVQAARNALIELVKGVLHGGSTTSRHAWHPRWPRRRPRRRP
jgi:hypothetical protein